MSSDLEFVDTHCHIQFADYGLDSNTVIDNARAMGVSRMIVVGCSLEDSHLGVEFVESRDGIWASTGLHPHEASKYVHDHHALQSFRDLATKPKGIAIGETGLDFYYNNSPRDAQEKLLRFQLDLALEHDLPVIFHVRDAFNEFWPIFDEYSSNSKPIRGVVHSFSSDTQNLEQIISRGLYVGINGIMTFTNRPEQLESAKKVPQDRLLLETDAPFLTPKPFRGTIGEPKYVRTTGEFLANLRNESLTDIARFTTTNAKTLFGIE